MIAALIAMTLPFAVSAAEPEGRLVRIESKIVAVTGVDFGALGDDGPSWQYPPADDGPESPFPWDAQSEIPEFDIPGAEATVLARPQVNTRLGSEEAVLQIGANPVPYFEPIDNDQFQLRRESVSPVISVSYTVNETPQPEIIHLQGTFDVTQVIGREAIEGVDLPVGRPEVLRLRNFTVEGQFAVDTWFIRAIPASEQRAVLMMFRITDLGASARQPNPDNYTVNTRLVRVDADVWSALLGEEDPCIEILRSLDADMSEAVPRDVDFADALPDTTRGALVVIPGACWETLLADRRGGFELITAPRATWTPQPAQDSTEAQTLFKIVASNLHFGQPGETGGGGFGGGFGGGGGAGGGSSRPAPEASGLNSLFEFLQRVAPRLWEHFNPISGGKDRPVLISDTTMVDGADDTVVYNGAHFAYRIRNAGSETMTVEQGGYFRLDDGDQIAVHESILEAPFSSGQTLVSAFRLPAKGDVVLVFATLEALAAQETAP